MLFGKCSYNLSVCMAVILCIRSKITGKILLIIELFVIIGDYHLKYCQIFGVNASLHKHWNIDSVLATSEGLDPSTRLLFSTNWAKRNMKFLH